MRTRPFHSRWVVCLLVGIAAMLSTTPLTAAPGTQNPPGPTSFHVEVIANGGPTFFGNAFEGLGDLVVVATASPVRGHRGKGGHQEGTEPTLSGRVRFARGLTTNRDLWEWRQQVLATAAASAQHDVSVVLYDQNFAPVARWELTDAWPSNVTYSLAADGSAQEELELTY